MKKDVNKSEDSGKWKRVSLEMSEEAYKDLDYLSQKYGMKKKVLISKIIRAFRKNEEDLIKFLFDFKGRKE